MPPGIPEAGRPADPGEEVDQGGALEAEGAADRPLLLVPLYRERRATGRGKPVTDSARSGLRPIPLARPPEFVVCPLMREIRAFRYFWPSGLI
jgi:hypothetical protein